MLVFKTQKLEKYLLKNFDQAFAKYFRRLFFRSGELSLLENKCKLKEIYRPKLTVFFREDSKIDGASKIILKTNDNYFIEMVILRINTGRITLCVSSQIGCTEKCIFCTTGQSGFQRNLTMTEICEQVIIARQILKKENKILRNLVFMGMGEPLRNFKNIIEAISLLSSAKHFGFSPNHITLSTLGVVDKIIPLVKRFPKIQLALSLNAPNDIIRQKIMPINEIWNMSKLKAVLKKLSKSYNKQIFIEYILFKKINDSLEHCKQMAEFLKDLNVKINLIPYNRNDYSKLEPTEKKIMNNFKKKLSEFGFKVTLRYSLGQDIKAACGQLAKKLK